MKEGGNPWSGETQQNAAKETRADVEVEVEDGGDVNLTDISALDKRVRKTGFNKG